MGKGGWHGVGEIAGENTISDDGSVGRGDFGNGTIVGKIINSFDDAFSSVFQDVYSVAPIVFRSAADVPNGDTMG